LANLIESSPDFPIKPETKENQMTPLPPQGEKNEPEKLAGEQPQPVAEVELDATTGKPVEAPKPAESSVSTEEFRKL
jgi:hypothetical protein